MNIIQKSSIAVKCRIELLKLPREVVEIIYRESKKLVSGKTKNNK